MSYLSDEIASQPACWSQAIEMAASAALALPRPGERVAAIGCGSSLNVARCYAALREAAGQGETDAFPASEVAAGHWPRDRSPTFWRLERWCAADFFDDWCSPSGRHRSEERRVGEECRSRWA